MTRKECLDKAAECVLKDRQNQYGKPEDSFGMIAAMWSAYLGCAVSAHDVAAMMALLKIARFRHNPFHEDNAVDLAGYAACMVETATAWERECEKEPAPAPVHVPEDFSFDESRCRQSMPGIVPQDGPSDFDAPQTPEEVCQRIVDCNPATYGRPHKPTGEELAEMAEGDENHG